MWIMFDDGRPSIAKHLQGATKACAKICKLLHIVYREDCLIARRDSMMPFGQARTRGFMNLRQVECAHFITAADCARLPKRMNRHHEGSSSGIALQSVGIPDLLADGWMMTVAEKRVLMGAGRAAVDAADIPGEDACDLEDIPGVAGAQSAAKKHRKGDHDMVPFNFKQMIPDLYDEILHRTGAKAVIDLTASDGVLALACLAAGTPYIGICHNALHATAMKRRLQSQVFQKLSDVSMPFFNDALAELLAGDPRVQAADATGSTNVAAKARGKRSKSTSKDIKSATKKTTRVNKAGKKSGNVAKDESDKDEELEEASDEDEESAADSD